jgi:WhiB family redox-sensing transcriptional regulator
MRTAHACGSCGAVVVEGVGCVCETCWEERRFDLLPELRSPRPCGSPDAQGRRGAMDDWTKRAACARLGGALDLMFDRDRTRQAKAVCRGCSVVEDCLADALAHGDEFGVRGGMTPRERERHAERLGLPKPAYRTVLNVTVVRSRLVDFKPTVKRHGTRSGYVSGCGCEPCRAAERAYQQARPKRTRSTAAPVGETAVR